MTNLISQASLQGIITFVTAANTGSFTTAAEVLGVTKSAVGKSISNLERRLDTQLFHRTTRKISLTSDGDAYLSSCVAAINELMAAEAILSHKKTVPSGIVKIDMPAAFGRAVMMPILLEIVDRYPELKLILSFNDKIIDPLEDGIDLVIRFGSLKDTGELVAKRLNDQKLVICASPAYLERYGTPTSIDELCNHRLLLGYRRGGALAWLIKDQHGRDVRFNPTATHQISDGGAMIQACIAGSGIAQFPESILKDCIRSNSLIEILSEISPDPIPLNVLWPKTRHLLPKVRFIVDELVKRNEHRAFG